MPAPTALIAILSHILLGIYLFESDLYVHYWLNTIIQVILWTVGSFPYPHLYRHHYSTTCPRTILHSDLHLQTLRYLLAHAHYLQAIYTYNRHCPSTYYNTTYNIDSSVNTVLYHTYFPFPTILSNLAIYYSCRILLSPQMLLIVVILLSVPIVNLS